MNHISRVEEEIAHGWHELQREWTAVLDDWHDPVQRSFEREYWELFEREVPRFMHALNRIAEVIHDAEAELGD